MTEVAEPIKVTNTLAPEQGAVQNLIQLVPSKLIDSAYKPDFSYALDIESNSSFQGGGQTFTITDTVRFDFSSSFSDILSSSYLSLIEFSSVFSCPRLLEILSIFCA